MKIYRILTGITISLGVLSFLCLIGNFLALQDIFHDYVSQKVINGQGLVLTLPAWTSCPGEWKVVGIGYWFILAFHVMLFFLFASKRKLTKGSSYERV
jgi:hypothetical protein